ncbi:MAG: CvpA family protein [Ruminococcaceae bacterium]|nr:CvpA family protein [Oscillospiraceae bacterium]
MSTVLFFDILFVLFFLGFVVFGIRRGFIKSFFRSVGLILSFVASYVFGDSLSSLFCHLFVKEWVYQGVYGTVAGILAESMEGMNADSFLSRFPPFLISEDFRCRVAELFSTQTGERLTSALAEGISVPLSSLLSSLLGYVAAFVIAFFVLRMFAWGGTEIAERIAPLGFLNRFLGGAWGALTGAASLLLVCAVIKLFFKGSEIYTDSVVVRAFCDSAFLSFLNF